MERIAERKHVNGWTAVVVKGEREQFFACAFDESAATRTNLSNLPYCAHERLGRLVARIHVRQRGGRRRRLRGRHDFSIGADARAFQAGQRLQ